MFCLPLFCQEYLPAKWKVYDSESLASFELRSSKGSVIHFPASSKQIRVIALLSPECPLCKNYSVKLISLKNKFEKTVNFIGIIPGSFDAKDVAEFQKQYMPSWEILRDTSLKLTHYLEGKVTPEVIVIDNKNGRLIYKGAIDDWLVSLGKTKNHISNYYLEVALNNFFNDKPAIPFTEPVGCLINDF